ncbi:MAG: hypothetical protein WCO58_01860 [bacterium]
MEDTEAEKHALLVLERYNEQKELQKNNRLTGKENIFTAVMHQVYTELKENSSFVIDETTFFREVGKECNRIQPKKTKEPSFEKAKNETNLTKSRTTTTQVHLLDLEPLSQEDKRKKLHEEDMDEYLEWPMVLVPTGKTPDTKKPF